MIEALDRLGIINPETFLSAHQWEQRRAVAGFETFLPHKNVDFRS
jgi:hypothetical protein